MKRYYIPLITKKEFKILYLWTILINIHLFNIGHHLQYPELWKQFILSSSKQWLLVGIICDSKQRTPHSSMTFAKATKI